MNGRRAPRLLAVFGLAALGVGALVVAWSSGAGAPPLVSGPERGPWVADARAPTAPDLEDAKPARAAPPTPPVPAPVAGGEEAAARPLRGVTVDVDGAPLGGVLVGFAPTERTAAGGLRFTHSDEDGRFELRALPPECAGVTPTVARAGYLPWRLERAQHDADGGWVPLRLVLGPSATLQLTVVDAADAPLAGVGVRVTIVGSAGASRWSSARVPTDPDGRLALGVHAGEHLAVHLDHVGWDAPAERTRAGELTHDPTGAPLVLAPGEERALLARAGVTVVLRGVVRLPDDAPLADAAVRVLEGAPEENPWFEAGRNVRTDARGRFEVELRGLEPEGLLTVLAVDGELLSIQGEDLPRHGASRRVEVARLLADPAPIELVVEALSGISGRVVDAAGEPVTAVVWAVPAGEPYVLHKGSLGFLPLVAVRGGRPFELRGLVPGVHDLIVKRDSPRTYHRFSGVETGAPPRDFVVEDNRVVRIRLVVEGSAPGDRVQPVLLRHQPRDPDAWGDPPPSGRVRVAGLDETARAGLDARTGGSARTSTKEHPGGRTITFLREVVEAGEHDLPPQQAGCYSVGLLAWNATGRPYARRLSPPYRLTAGDFEFVVTLEPTASLVGAAPAALGAGLHVQVRDAQGRVVRTLDGAPTTPVDARGSFRVAVVPPGRLEVRLGTPAGLAVGMARRVVSVVVEAGEELEVTFP